MQVWGRFDMIENLMNEISAPVLGALLVAVIFLAMLLRWVWRFSAARTQRKLLAGDPHGYGPAGKERIADLESQHVILDSKINRLKNEIASKTSQLAQAETEISALHADREEARRDNMRLTDAVNYWQARSEVAEIRLSEARIQYAHLLTQARSLGAILEQHAESGDNSTSTAPASDEPNELAAANETSPEHGTGQDDMGQAERAQTRRPFIAGERPAPEHLPPSGMRTNLQPVSAGARPMESARNTSFAMSRPGEDQNEAEDSGPPKPIDMDELARRIRALESGV